MLLSLRIQQGRAKTSCFAKRSRTQFQLLDDIKAGRLTLFAVAQRPKIDFWSSLHVAFSADWMLGDFLCFLGPDSLTSSAFLRANT
jgi:hypothetical protein